jgi:glutamyl aminopeptidase
MLSFPELIAYQEEMAKKAKVKTQYFSSPGGTDAGAFHKSGEGVLTLTHCICARNLHTCSTILDVEDYLAAKKTLITLLNDFDQTRLNKLKGVRR